MLIKYFLSFSIFLILNIFFSGYFNDCNDTILTFPIHSPYRISSEYGIRTLGSKHFHNGIDIPKKEGTPIYALCPGVISNISFSSSYGNYIIITYENGYKSLYGHTNGDYPFREGDFVTSTDIVAYVGPKYLSNGKLNGFTTGPHLNFTLYKDGNLLNPLSLSYNYIS